MGDRDPLLALSNLPRGSFPHGVPDSVTKSAEELGLIRGQLDQAQRRVRYLALREMQTTVVLLAEAIRAGETRKTRLAALVGMASNTQWFRQHYDPAVRVANGASLEAGLGWELKGDNV